MSIKFKDSKDIPTDVLVNRVREIVGAITAPSERRLMTELSMRAPAELDRDADLVLSEVARRLTAFEIEILRLKDQINNMDSVKKGLRCIE